MYTNNMKECNVIYSSILEKIVDDNQQIESFKLIPSSRSILQFQNVNAHGTTNKIGALGEVRKKIRSTN